MSETTKRKRSVEPSKTPEQRLQERRERFRKYVELRVNNALKRLTQVARLGNRANYSYTDEEAAKVCAAIMDATVQVQDSFTESNSEKPQFRL